MKLNNSSLTFFNQRRGKIENSRGGWRIGEAVYNHGYSMMDDLVGKHSYFQVMLLNVTGKMHSKQLCEWLEASYICMSWPDPRIWCNQIAALAGSNRTTPAAAVLAGTLASDSSMYGPGSLPKCMDVCQLLDRFEHDFQQVLDYYTDAQGKAVVPGFSRPIAKGDERVVAMRKLSRELGFRKGPHETLAENFENWLYNAYDESINIGGYTAAFLLDRGFTKEEVYRFASTRVTAGVQACYAEYFDQPAGAYLPMAVQDINYTGPKKRAL